MMITIVTNIEQKTSNKKAQRDYMKDSSKERYPVFNK